MRLTFSFLVPAVVLTSLGLAFSAVIMLITAGLVAVAHEALR
jgi:hypothetical protein